MSEDDAAETLTAFEPTSPLPQCKIKRNYTCSLCTTYFTQNPRSYLYHLRDTHGQRLRVYECSRCLYASRHSQKLQRHLHMVHEIGTGGDAFRPPKTPRPQPTPDASPLSEDVQDEACDPALETLRDAAAASPPPHLVPAVSPPGPDEDGDEEDDEELAEGAMQNPEEAMDVEDDVAGEAFVGVGVDFRCSVCPFRAASRSLLARHEALAHLKKKFFRCGKCSYATHLRARFTKHVKYHSMPMIKCSQCDFRTPYKWNLDRHCRNHGAAGAFRCSRCSFTADIKQSLTVHEMNHHAPPTGPVPPNRRRLKVGASDSLLAEEREMLARQRGQGASAAGATGGPTAAASPSTEVSPSDAAGHYTVRKDRPARIKTSAVKRIGKSSSCHVQQQQQHNFRTDFIHPDDIIHHKNGNVYIKTLRCRLCNFKAAWEGEMARHETKVHGIRKPVPHAVAPPALARPQTPAAKPKAPRPIPNLIPIQSKMVAGATPPILRIPSVRRSVPPAARQRGTDAETLSERDMDEICAKSCATSSLKDFAPLIGSDAFALENKSPEQALTLPLQAEELGASAHDDAEEDLMVSMEIEDGRSVSYSPRSEGSLRKGTFLDQLGERLLHCGAALECDVCGVRASCMSELARHKRVHDTTSSAASAPPPTPGELSSTRCQRCRQRCKTSADLLVHLRSCGAPAPVPSHGALSSSASSSHGIAGAVSPGVRAASASVPTSYSFSKTSAVSQSKDVAPTTTGVSISTSSRSSTLAAVVPLTSSSVLAPSTTLTATTSLSPSAAAGPTVGSIPTSPNQAASPTFNSSSVPVLSLLSVTTPKASGDSPGEESPQPSPHPMENRVFVWNNLPSPSACLENSARAEDLESSMDTSPVHQNSLDRSSPDLPKPVIAVNTSSIGTVKKVFKCPHCVFWASTASRFHVHIVGHLNKKPFECSLCSYRSNWRWDITKHIRLKSARDAGHERARVLMTDETGRRNYSKYNKYLTVLRVRDGNAHQAVVSQESPVSQTVMQTSEPPKPIVTSTKLLLLTTKAVTAPSLSSNMSTKVDACPSLRPLLPAPPRLTPAPTAVTTQGPPPLTLAPIRPPPPLAPAVLPGPPRLHPAPKRPSPTPIENYPSQIPKKATGESRRTLWKCKKCNYKDSQRELVLAHVKQHYQQRAQALATTQPIGGTLPVRENNSLLKRDGSMHIATADNSAGGLFPEMGTNGQLQDDEDEEERIGGREREEDREQDPDEGETDLLNKHLQCPICPYKSVDAEEMNQHQLNHQPQNGAIFKCYLCPYYVPMKMELHEHLQLHGVSQPEEHLSRTLHQNQIMSSSPTSNKITSNESELVDSGNVFKRYRCAGCPYVSNSKSQFLYHKQFHRPRGAPFKCGLCSYNVSRRHLLHQHLKVHGILIPPQRSPGDPEYDGSECNALEEGEEEAAASGALRLEAPDLDTRQFPEVPLVWVSRNGRFDKLFKCRWCPHVNQRKANIIEHEKMHRRDDVDEHSGEESSLNIRPLPPHRCLLCNYGCHNAGVLSAHMKVHQGIYGTVRALVDSSRSDEAQLEELGSASDSLPPVLLPQTNNDVSQSIEDGQEETLDFRIEPSLASDPPPSLEEEIPHDDGKILMFCQQCPARFLELKELNIHKRFHEIRLAHRCESCSYTARHRPHLLAHVKVHSNEYQDQTESLTCIYAVSSIHSRPRTAVIVEGPGVSGPVWVVVSGGLSTGPAAPPELDDIQDFHDVPPPLPRSTNKQFSCTLCPAKFFKSVALEYHKTLHGGPGNYGCKFCDYRVKTYGNLVKHEMIHEQPENELSKAPVLSTRNRNSCVVPLSGTDLFQQKAEVQKQTESGHCRISGDLPVDPQFGTLMHGNPEFVYPMYFKNGRLKEKRYKCHKCPSAFEKREQYKVHLSLHGAKQRYKCEKCDYSVKYYANFIQHQRKHDHNEEAHAARRAAITSTSATAVEDDEGTETESQKPPVLTPKLPALAPRSTKSIGGGPPNKQSMSAAEQQAKMLQLHSQVSTSSPTEEERKTMFRCSHCPYASTRKDGLESHAKRHAAVSGSCGAFVCQHCDYSAPQLHFLREHVKLHFDAPRKIRCEAYTHFEKLTIWCQTSDSDEENRQVLFQDNGTSVNDPERFCPLLPVEFQHTEDNESSIFVDPRTGDPLGDPNPKDSVVAGENSGVADNSSSQVPESRPSTKGNRSSIAASSLDDTDKNGVKDVETGVDNVGIKKIVEHVAEEELINAKLAPATKSRKIQNHESRRDKTTNSSRSRTQNKCKTLQGCDSESEENEKVEIHQATHENVEFKTFPSDGKIPARPQDDGESLSASSSCDSSTSTSSSGSSSSSSSSSSSTSSSSSSSSSSSGSASSSTSNNNSKSSDSSSDSEVDDSDVPPVRAQSSTLQDDNMTSDTDVL